MVLRLSAVVGLRVGSMEMGLVIINSILVFAFSGSGDVYMVFVFTPAFGFWGWFVFAMESGGGIRTVK